MAIDMEKHPHPIIFLEKITNGVFKACIISTKKINGNKLMSTNHFEKTNSKGEEYSIQFKPSYLVVSDSFIKMDAWIDESKGVVGKLTAEGIVFVEDNMSETHILCVASMKEFKMRKLNQIKSH